MACTSVRVLFEIGHEASLKAKQTADGFTHDWKLFVRGVDNAEIHHFVEKVIFHLHETFQNPKRVVKEPPYVVRESGYAGFALFVDIYFKSKQESSKVRFEYQLTLPEAGPPISNKIREEYVFNNPPEEFRRKLIRGGGFGVGEESTSSSHMPINSSQSDADHKNSLKSKSSLLDLPSTKKPKKENTPKNEEKLNANDPFSIFGQPILHPSKIPIVTKSNSKLISSSEKISQSDKQVHSSKPPKHNVSSSHKDKERDKEKERDKDKERGDKEKHKTKERDKEKEKSALKKSKDESLKKEKSKDDKMKVLKSSKEEAKKNAAYHDEKPPKEKLMSSAQTVPPPPVEKGDKEAKAEKKDKEKKHKEEKKQKSKEKREKASNGDKKENMADAAKENYGGSDRVSVAEKHQLAHAAPSLLTKDDSYAVKEEKKAARKDAVKDERLEAKVAKDKVADSAKYAANGSLPAPATSVDAAKRDEKHKHHKHKKDKSKKEAKRERDDKKEKLAKGRCTPPVAPAAQPVVLLEAATIVPKHEPGVKHATKKPLDQLFSSEKSDSDSSSMEEEPVPVKVEPVEPAPPPIKEEPAETHNVRKTSALLDESGPELDSAPKKKKSKKSAEEKEAKKRKRKSKEKALESAAVAAKLGKFEGLPPEPLKSLELQPESRSESRQTSLSPGSAGEPKFTDEYITKLKELQRKIMTLEDNSGLQRIVQVVAETGQYEITTKTFDFDLCSLDESIVNRLSDFFLP